ncbi:MAG TPA: outer membrane beta-barrel protein [Catalimonadaceae bacterium]|nr:outer membrane beta-barrel protein [Catalimonadaceae bacterium]
MKTQFLAVSLALASFAAFGQEAETTSLKGKLGIGGTFGYYKTEQSLYSNYKIESFTVAPNFSWFITKNVVTGLAISYRSIELISSEKRTLLSVAPMVQYLIPLGSEKFGLFAQANLSFGLGKFEILNFQAGTSTTDETEFSGGISPGIYFFPSSRFMLTASFGSIFRYSKETSQNSSNVSSSRKNSIDTIEILNFSTSVKDNSGLQIGGMFLF